MGLANNVNIQRLNRAKTADIPFTIVGTGTANATTITIDNPFSGDVEAFCALSEIASQDGALGGAGGGAASLLDPSANTGGKAFPAALSLAAPPTIGFIVLDGGQTVPLATMTAPGGDPSNPGYVASPTPIGSAIQLFECHAEISDAPSGAPILGICPVAKLVVTQNGNLQVTVVFPSWFPSGSGANTAFKLDASGTYRGTLHLAWT